MAWFAYVLVSTSGRTYVGTTTDVARRLRQHNGEIAGGARTTRAGRPWVVGRVLGPFAGRGDALRVELTLRRLRGARRLTDVRYGEGPPGSSPAKRRYARLLG